MALFSQNLEIIGGINKNIFFDFQEDDGHSRSTYNSQLGYEIHAAIEDVKIGEGKWKFTLGFENYGGEINAIDGSLGGSYATNAKIDKSIITVGVYPFNFKIIDRIILNFGFEIGGLVHENVTGTTSRRGLHQPAYTYDLNGRTPNYNAPIYLGLRGRIAYDFNISDKMAISPQYSYYFGVSPEFKEFPSYTKSMRHFLGIGIKRSLE